MAICLNITGPVQVYCKRTDDSATVITDQLLDRLRKLKFECKMKNLEELSRSETTIFVCFKATRLLADVKEAFPYQKNRLLVNYCGKLAANIAARLPQTVCGNLTATFYHANEVCRNLAANI